MTARHRLYSPAYDGLPKYRLKDREKDLSLGTQCLPYFGIDAIASAGYGVLSIDNRYIGT